ncbi:MAG TPA: hypothetical protein VFS54_02720 [Solirubrobacterales bacterium]|nr:hypothetical protein [Solirubrobacterales bacterium]
MKVIKLLSLLAVAAAALMACIGNASATTVTGPGGNTTPFVHAESEEDKEVKPGTKHVVLHNGIAKIECNSTASGTVEKHGPGIKAAGEIKTLIFGTKATEGCTNGWVVHVTTPGELGIEDLGANKGTLYSTGATIVATRLKLECWYKTSTTDIGTVTGGATATLKIKGVIPFHGGSPLCGGAASWTGSYVTTEELNIHS